MVQITRDFDNPGRANAALDDLRSQGFNTAELASGPDGRGKTTLRIEPPFGTAVRVEQILDRHANGAPATAPRATTPVTAPQPAGVVVAPKPPQPPSPSASSAQPAGRASAKRETDTAVTAGSEAPKSATSTRNGTTTGTKSGPRTLSQLLGIPELIDSDTFFSGFPLLIRPTPKRPDQPPAKPS
ncbi:conserved hypothetical protein [Rhodopseudomonas palustris HaA2]|uniref:Uncharacterized protein n=1 Tax=Rhodopseudomonas palustris (strain HaA2) TaxID=316058 RepID=Q2J254_RHOP2|nr:hypothetical protein [Rhodopseudomonas palustris]ABD05456.1 conserved hypothetical protein [Rhodopseudomonas palustris HaA2]